MQGERTGPRVRHGSAPDRWSDLPLSGPQFPPWLWNNNELEGLYDLYSLRFSVPSPPHLHPLRPVAEQSQAGEAPRRQGGDAHEHAHTTDSCTGQQRGPQWGPTNPRLGQSPNGD